MDRRTVDFYDKEASERAARYRAVDSSAWKQQFREAFSPGGRVLDVGSGSGRDLALLLSLGFDAYGVEPAAGMREVSVSEYPELRGKIFDHSLPFPEGAEFGGLFDGVVCSAVLMHLPEAELFDAVCSLKRVLKEKGRIWLSVPGHRSGLNAEWRDETGRLFRDLTPEFVTGLFERLGFQLLRRWEEADRLGRPEIIWNSFLFELAATRSRPLDRTE